MIPLLFIVFDVLLCFLIVFVLMPASRTRGAGWH